jgi:hypothetical protein
MWVHVFVGVAIVCAQVYICDTVRAVVWCECVCTCLCVNSCVMGLYLCANVNDGV